ncbi:hypothetical protein PG996_013288 [Apiospora saccharicola]|uniref:Bacteriophage T5 Orf172 DNA-binding domain-containing protein n=1 Tax=Apiospora saccharicola TaxID=335842 RepID=A0ABR1U535_9PEZI
MSPVWDATWFDRFHQYDPTSYGFKCIYFTKKGERCKWGASNTQRASELRQEILDPSSTLTNTDLLEEYIRCLCDNRGYARHCDRIEDDGILVPLAERWKNEILEQRGLRSSIVLIESTPPPPLPEFRPRMRTPGPEDSVFHKILDPLIERDAETGSLYIFSRPSSPGYVKIGWTAHKVEGRLEGWAKCGYTPHLLFRVYSVPHAQRVETLTHYELIKEWRKQRPCVQCGGVEHHEWFEISRRKAKKSLRLWASFMAKAVPYDSNGYLKSEWQQYVQQVAGDDKPVTARVLWKCHKKLLASEATHQVGVADTECVTVKEEERAGGRVYEVDEDDGTLTRAGGVKEEKVKEEEQQEDGRLFVVDETKLMTKDHEEEVQVQERPNYPHWTGTKKDTNTTVKICEVDEKGEGGHSPPTRGTAQPPAGNCEAPVEEKDDRLCPDEDSFGGEKKDGVLPKPQQTGIKGKRRVVRRRKNDALG